MSNNYFNTLPLRVQLAELAKCRFMHISEFPDGVTALKGKKMVVIGCGAQGLNQGLNLRDSGLDVSYTLRQAAIDEQRHKDLKTSQSSLEEIFVNLLKAKA